MTALIVGGQSQGKLDIAFKITGFSHEKVFDCVKNSEEELKDEKIVNNLHLLTRKVLKEKGTLEGLLDKLIGKLVICNEIGCGIVPMDAFERRWREETGRLCCDLAEKSDFVVRVHCGIAQCIKGEIKWKSS